MKAVVTRLLQFLYSKPQASRTTTTTTSGMSGTTKGMRIAANRIGLALMCLAALGLPVRAQVDQGTITGTTTDTTGAVIPGVQVVAINPSTRQQIKAVTNSAGRLGQLMCWQPILWIEELDKIKATDTRLSWLFNLIDVIYEYEGLLITTTNLTIVELKAMLGGPRLRRLTGTGVKEEHYLLWDFHKYQPGNR